MSEKSVLILTLPLGRNYGGILQAYALQRVIREMGHQVETVSSSGSIFRRVGERFPFVEKNIRKLLGKEYVPFKITARNTSRFISKNIAVTSFNRARLNALLGKYEIVITGSDQVWRKAYAFLPHTFLAFSMRNAQKISYAASFGKDEIHEYSDIDRSKSGKALRSFKAISVRETAGREIIRTEWNLDSSVHIDPTLLLSAEEYSGIAEKGGLKTSTASGKLFFYCLDDSPLKIDLNLKLEDSLNLESFQLISGHLNKGEPLPPVEEWIQSFAESSFVLTDSFHGMVFSIIFQKSFLVIGNSERGLARFESLLSKLGLEERLVKVDNHVNLEQIQKLASKPIEWTKVQQRLSLEKNASMDYLQTNLQ